MATMEIDTLTQLIDDAKHMPAAMLPRPRAMPRAIDLTGHEVTIPESTAHLVDGYDDYGA